MVKNPEDHPYSSFRYYLGRGKEPEFLETDWLLGQLHKHLSQARKAFYQFTLDGLNHPWSPEEGVRLGIVLGEESFYEKIRKRYLDGREDREIPVLRKSQRIPETGEIRACIEGCVPEKGMRKRLLVWALKRYTPLKLTEIAERIQSQISYSAVSQICRRVEEERMRNPKLEALMNHIEAEMSKVKT